MLRMRHLLCQVSVSGVICAALFSFHRRQTTCLFYIEQASCRSLKSCKVQRHKTEEEKEEEKKEVCYKCPSFGQFERRRFTREFIRNGTVTYFGYRLTVA